MLTALIALAMVADAMPARPDAPPCARRLSISFANPNGDFDGMSHSGAYMTVQNLGPHACRVPGLPTVGLAGARGVVIAARAAPAFMHPGPVILPVVLAPRVKATAELRWVSGDVYEGHNCATPARVTVTFDWFAVTKPWSGGQICGPAGKLLPFTQTPLLAALPAMNPRQVARRVDSISPPSRPIARDRSLKRKATATNPGEHAVTDSLAIRRQLDQSMDADIAERTRVHQNRIAALNLARASLRSAVGAELASPLVLLALGDSWFDYPLYGNAPIPVDTDVIAQLRSLGAVNPVILNVSHFGDATTDELSLPKQQRLVAALADPANWLNQGKPDAILFSGGGNDIAGDRFCIYLDPNTPGSSGLDQRRYSGVLASVEASYRDLFAFRDRYAPGVPIFGHDYDFPVPNGVHPLCAGPWLKPSLTFQGWTNVDAGATIVQAALIQFRDLLRTLAADPDNGFNLIDTQGTLARDQWANELHPVPAGFAAIAAKFVAGLRGQFPRRI